MKITIKGSPKELAELTKVLNGTEKAVFPPLLTELADKPLRGRNPGNRGYKETIAKSPSANEESAPQAETAEQYIPFSHFISKFEELIKRTKEANWDV